MVQAHYKLWFNYLTLRKTISLHPLAITMAAGKIQKKKKIQKFSTILRCLSYLISYMTLASHLT